MEIRDNAVVKATLEIREAVYPELLNRAKEDTRRIIKDYCERECKGEVFFEESQRDFSGTQFFIVVAYPLGEKEV